MAGNVLTWRDVAAPDFSTAMQGFKQAGDQINSAGTSLNKGIEAFDTNRRNDAANALYQASMSYTDPTALKLAASNGELLQKAGVDPSLLTVQANQNIDNKAGTLLGQATQQIALDQSKVMNPELLRQQQLVNQGKILGNTYEAQSMPLKIQKLGTDIQSTQAGTEQTKATTDQTRESTTTQVQKRGQDKTTFDDNQTDKKDDGKAKEVASKIAQANTTWQAGLAALAKWKETDESFDDATKAKVLAHLPTQMKGWNPNITDLPTQVGNISLPTPGAAPTGASSAITGAVNPAPAVSSASIIGSLPDPETRSYVTGIIAKSGDLLGKSQEDIMRKLVPAIAASDTKTPVDENKLKTLLNRYKNNPEIALTAYKHGTDKTDDIVKYHPSVVRAEVSALASRASDAIAETAASTGQGNAPGVQSQYTALAGDKTSREDLIAGMKEKKGGQYSQIDHDKISEGMNQIENMFRKANYEPTQAQVAALMNRYGSFSKNWVYRNGVKFSDEAGLKQEINKIAQRNRFEGANQIDHTAALAQSIKASQERQTKAAAALQTAQEARANGREISNLPELQKEYSLATKTLQDTLTKFNKPEGVVNKGKFTNRAAPIGASSELNKAVNSKKED